MNPIGFGIIGSGMIAGIHHKAISEIEGCRVNAVVSPVPGEAAAFAEKIGAKGYVAMDEFLADPGVNAVMIASPSGLHLDGALAAIEADKHTLVEKPLEITIERCDRIIEAAKRKGVKLGGIFHSRYFAVPKLIRKAVEEGRFGAISIATAQVKWYRSQDYYDKGAWRGTWNLDGGGALMNQSIHAVDLLQWFMGPVTEVFGRVATLAHERIEVEDTAVATLRFANGALGTIEGTTAAYPGFFKRIEICGSRGSVVMEEEDLKIWEFMDETDADREIKARHIGSSGAEGGASDPAAIGYLGHKMEIEDFVDAIRRNREFALNGEEVRKSVEIIEAAYRSSRTGNAVSLPL